MTPIWRIAACLGATLLPSLTTHQKTQSSSEEEPIHISLHLGTYTYPMGTTDEREYGTWLDEQQRHIEAAIQSADSEDAIKLERYYANWILAIRVEPHISRLLWDVNDEEDARSLIRLSTRAVELLNAEQNEPASEDVELLLHFARAVSAVAQARSETAPPNALNEAIWALTVWLDDRRPGVSSSAALWIGWMYLLSRQTERAMKTLPIPLSPTHDLIGFHARLLRCRVLAEQNQATAALAILLKMQEQSLEWFESSAVQACADYSAAAVRVRIAERRAKLDPEGAANSWEAITQRAKEYLNDLQPDAGLIRMYPAVPWVIPHPKIEGLILPSNSQFKGISLETEDEIAGEEG